MNKRGLPRAKWRACRATKSRGFTLIEMIMAITIAGVIASIFAIVINSGMGSWFFIKGQRSIMMETRGAMKRMTREIRRTKDSSSSSILNFTSTRYRFKDVDDTTIDYQQDGTDLERNGTVLLQDLANSGGLSFVYLDASGGAAGFVEDIRTVQITIIVEEGDNRVRLRSAAGIRNR